MTYLRNTKTGTIGKVVCRYVNTQTGKAMVQVSPVSQLKDAYWLAAHTEEVA